MSLMGSFSCRGWEAQARRVSAPAAAAYAVALLDGALAVAYLSWNALAFQRGGVHAQVQGGLALNALRFQGTCVDVLGASMPGGVQVAVGGEGPLFAPVGDVFTAGFTTIEFACLVAKAIRPQAPRGAADVGVVVALISTRPGLVQGQVDGEAVPVDELVAEVLDQGDALGWIKTGGEGNFEFAHDGGVFTRLGLLGGVP